LWRGPERAVGTSADRVVEGIATRVTFDLTFDILSRELDDIVTLSEDELAEGVRLALTTTHNLPKGRERPRLPRRTALEGRSWQLDSAVGRELSGSGRASAGRMPLRHRARPGARGIRCPAAGS